MALACQDIEQDQLATALRMSNALSAVPEMDINDEEPLIDLHPEDVKAMSVNLENLQYCLERAFNYIDKYKIHNKNTVLCLGNTGCGKSTMITALIYGKQVLEQKRKEREITRRDGTTKISYDLIIDHKPGVNIKGFKIGHNPANSETFLPHFWKD